MSVTPGEVLDVVVGGEGNSSTGGFNGGGPGGNSCGGGGGGSSYFEPSGTSASYNSAVADSPGDGNGQVTISWCCSTISSAAPEDTSGNVLTAPVAPKTKVMDNVQVSNDGGYNGTALPSGSVTFTVCR